MNVVDTQHLYINILKISMDLNSMYIYMNNLYMNKIIFNINILDLIYTYPVLAECFSKTSTRPASWAGQSLEQWGQADPTQYALHSPLPHFQ